MPIDTTHPDYDRMLKQWERCRDVTEGNDAVKARGERYLPKLTEQEDGEYEAYKMRAYWFGGTARTVDGLTGAVMRKEPTVEGDTELLADFKRDVSQTGQALQPFIKTAFEEVLKVGRHGVLVEMPNEITVGARPYWVSYQAEAITNWQTEMQAGIPTLIFIVLREMVVTESPDDPYELEDTEQYRELYLEDGIYKQQLWRRLKTAKGELGEWSPFEDEIIPTERGEPMRYIPFTFIGPTSVTPQVVKSPILDLVDANLSHYRNSADLEHGRHFCGLPTPWVAGFEKETQMRIGSSIAWVSSDPNAKAGMLEFTGQGLGALETALKDKKQDMAILGARLLESQQNAVEANDTLKTRLAGEQSILQSMAESLSTGFTRLMRWTAAWMGAGESSKKIVVKLNTELIDQKMTFAELAELIKSWQAGAISYETMYFNMERGGVTRPGVKWEKEKAQIDLEAPAVIPQNIDPLTGLPLVEDDPTKRPLDEEQDDEREE